jgi:uncharacterized membrane-anchored protein YitT (DUF2179 family)
LNISSCIYWAFVFLFFFFENCLFSLFAYLLIGLFVLLVFKFWDSLYILVVAVSTTERESLQGVWSSWLGNWIWSLPEKVPGLQNSLAILTVQGTANGQLVIGSSQGSLQKAGQSRGCHCSTVLQEKQ